MDIKVRVTKSFVRVFPCPSSMLSRYQGLMTGEDPSN
jgi:hypothetical protein